MSTSTYLSLLNSINKLFYFFAANSEKWKNPSHGTFQIDNIQLPSVKLILKLMLFISKRLWRSFFLCLMIFGTLCVYYILKQNSTAVENEDYEQLHVKDYVHIDQFQNFDNLRRNDELNLYNQNMARDRNEYLEQIISKHHVNKKSQIETQNHEAIPSQAHETQNAPAAHVDAIKADNSV